MTDHVSLAALRAFNAANYSEIYMPEWRGRAIGLAYVEGRCNRDNSCVQSAYRAFVEQTDAQYRHLTEDIGVRHLVRTEDPYPMEWGLKEAYEAMCDDIAADRVLATLSSAEYPHPIMTTEQNDQFRFVHDYYGHFMSGRGFDRHGEEAAWVLHAHMYSPLARRAMTTETRGQSSALCWVLGEFPEQKALLLPQGASQLIWSER